MATVSDSPNTKEIDKYAWIDLHIRYTMRFFDDDPIRAPETREFYTYDNVCPAFIQRTLDRWIGAFNRDERITDLHIDITEPNNSSNVFESVHRTRLS